MPIILYLLPLCLAVYVPVLLWFLVGLYRQPARQGQPAGSVSIIVAARDGGRRVNRLMTQLLAQDYTGGALEIILVDDGLAPADRAALQSEFQADARFRLMESATGDERLTLKKRALDAGIRASTGDCLLFTDADCQVGPGWVAAMMTYFAAGADFVIGHSGILPHPDAGWDDFPGTALRPLTAFEQNDFTMLMLAARGAAAMGKPWASSGQNQGYRRDLYERAGGFSALAHRIQGDDSLFLQEVRRHTDARVVFAADRRAWAVTEPAESVSDLVLQRMRWASDGLALWKGNLAFVPVSLAAFGSNALLIAAVALSFRWPEQIVPVLLPVVFIKGLAEGLFLYLGSRKIGDRALARHFPLWFLLQPLYLTTVGIGGLFAHRLGWRSRSKPAGAA